MIVRILTGLPYKDTQCGFKMFSREAADILTNKQMTYGWAFDVEYLYIAKLNNISVAEIPVIWQNDNDSRVSIIKDSIKFFMETCNIRKNKKKY